MNRIMTFVLGCIFSMNSIADPIRFGVHFHSLSNVNELNVKLFQSIRLWDSHTTWFDIEKKKNNFNFDEAHARINFSEKENFKVLLTLGGTPEWASLKPDEKCAYGKGCAAPPKNLEDWSNYTKRTAREFKGKIECYELWNEVSFPEIFSWGGGGGFFSGSVQDLVEISKAAYHSIKSEDPDACILSPSFHSSGNWIKKLNAYLAADGGRYFDKLSFHLYFGDYPEESFKTIAELKRVMKIYGLEDKSIWNTEVGIPFDQKIKRNSNEAPFDLVYSLVFRTYILNFAGGIERVYWYAYDNGVFGWRNSPAVASAFNAAVADIASLMKDSEGIYCNSSDKSLWRCDFHYKDKIRHIVWSVNNMRRIELPKGGRFFGRADEEIKPDQTVDLGIIPVEVY